MRLSDVQIRNLKPREKQYKVADFEGLFLTSKPTGARLWHFKYRIGGKEKQGRNRQDAERRGYTFAALAKTERLLGMANAEFGKKPISEITSPIILGCLRKVEATGNYETARRLRARLTAPFCEHLGNWMPSGPDLGQAGQNGSPYRFA